MARLQAFMTLAEGYATFVMDAVGARLLSDHARLKEAMERRRQSMSPGDALLERLLGLELKRRQYEDGVKFCRYVAGHARRRVAQPRVGEPGNAADAPRSWPTPTRGSHASSRRVAIRNLPQRTRDRRRAVAKRTQQVVDIKGNTDVTTLQDGTIRCGSSRSTSK